MRTVGWVVRVSAGLAALFALMAVVGIAVDLAVWDRDSPTSGIGIAGILGLVGLWACLFVVWVSCLVEAARAPETAWDAAGLDKVRWVIRLVILGWIGALFYLLIARRRLLAVTPPEASWAERRASRGEPWETPGLTPSKPSERRHSPPL